jgi:ribosomal protein L35AE/L33A
MPETITGVVMNYRMSRWIVHPHHMLLKFPGIDDDKAAQQILGKKVYWESPAGKILTGTIAAAHGKKGIVRAIFKKAGLPGQALGQKVILKK